MRPGDKLIFYGRAVGFALCEVRSSPFYDGERVCPDGDYPYRVRVTPPLKRNEAEDFSDVYRHLLDRTVSLTGVHRLPAWLSRDVVVCSGG